MTQPTRHLGLDARAREPGAEGVSQSPTDAALLSVADLSMRFGGVVALDGVSFQVASGKICGLIGPNGAGKTTLFNCLSRLYAPQRGEISFDGRSLNGVAKHQIARAVVTYEPRVMLQEITAIPGNGTLTLRMTYLQAGAPGLQTVAIPLP